VYVPRLTGISTLGSARRREGVVVPTLIQFSSIEPFVVAENFDRVNQHLSQQGPGLFNRLVGNELVRVAVLSSSVAYVQELGEDTGLLPD